MFQYKNIDGRVLFSDAMVSIYLNKMFISWRPSPRKNRERFGGQAKAEHIELNKFSISSISSLETGSCFLKACAYRRHIYIILCKLMGRNVMKYTVSELLGFKNEINSQYLNPT